MQLDVDFFKWRIGNTVWFSYSGIHFPIQSISFFSMFSFQVKKNKAKQYYFIKYCTTSEDYIHLRKSPYMFVAIKLFWLLGYPKSLSRTLFQSSW